MERNQRCRAIILRTYPVGEIHRGVVLLTETAGLVHAIAHGAASARGRLRAVAEVFVEGEAALYHNPVKHSTKLQEIDAPLMHYGLRENLLKYYVASLWVELVSVSFGGGGHQEGGTFGLLSDALAALDRAEESRALELSVYVLWRYLGILGFAPELEYCGECGRRFAPERPVFWPLDGGALRCEYCRELAPGETHTARPISPAGHGYLRRIASGRLRAEEALRARLAPEQTRALHVLLAAGVEQALETRLRTLESGATILYGRV